MAGVVIPTRWILQIVEDGQSGVTGPNVMNHVVEENSIGIDPALLVPVLG